MPISGIPHQPNVVACDAILELLHGVAGTTTTLKSDPLFSLGIFHESCGACCAHVHH